MAKLVWDRVGDRVYQTGVDRGVLYPQVGDGVPWNGLISVDETPSGGDPKQFYIDGYMYSQRAAREQFQGSIEAYTYPKEFELCDGSKNVSRGLYFTQQRRRPFGLCYRSGIGNDLSADHGYKLNIVYNALANPSSKKNATMSDNPELATFNWSFDTKPVRVAGYRPVPHIVIDSTETQLSLLSAVEDILYGSSIANARLPQPSEIITLFAGWPELHITDNGDGTFTVDGPDSLLSILNSTTFQISVPPAVNNGDGTFTISS